MVHNVPDDFEAVQMAIMSSSQGDTVLVAPGTYLENIIFNGREILVGSWYVTTGDTSYVELTKLGGGGLDPVVSFIHGEGRAAQLVGLTLYGGHANDGGGVFCSESSPTLRRLHIRDCEADYAGGGIFAEGGDPLVSECVIQNNSGGLWGGGGIGCEFSAMEIYGCTITANFGYESGGGIMVQDSAPVIVGNQIFGNDGGSYFGGGIGCRNSTPVITDNLVAANDGGQYGGGMFY
jgi:hypothetical protein